MVRRVICVRCGGSGKGPKPHLKCSNCKGVGYTEKKLEVPKGLIS